jgi:hypothetical protein
VRQLMSIFGLFMTTMGCNLPALHHHAYADYLNESVGHADHDAVARKMGAPHRTVTLDQGGDRWTYEYCLPSSYGSPTNVSATGTVSRIAGGNCQNLDLVFDNSGKLIHWHDQHFTGYR